MSCLQFRKPYICIFFARFTIYDHEFEKIFLEIAISLHPYLTELIRKNQT